MTVIRIQGEGQYRMTAAAVGTLNTLDDLLENALKARDEERFTVAFQSLLILVRDQERLPDDSLEPSDLILPPADATMTEVATAMAEDGLIPG